LDVPVSNVRDEGEDGKNPKHASRISAAIERMASVARDAGETSQEGTVWLLRAHLPSSFISSSDFS
jgi:hypothetical protein